MIEKGRDGSTWFVESFKGYIAGGDGMFCGIEVSVEGVVEDTLDFVFCDVEV